MWKIVLPVLRAAVAADAVKIPGVDQKKLDAVLVAVIDLLETVVK